MSQKPATRTVRDDNPDPITGEPGSHPIGTGVGAAAAGAAGAAVGSVAGPVGTVVGAVVGAVAGGLAGKATAESIDPTAEDAYWRANHSSRSYAQGTDYTVYQPAYRYGWEARTRYPDRRFEEIESELETDWSTTPGQRDLAWSKAKLAARDAWNRAEGRRARAK